VAYAQGGTVFLTAGHNFKSRIGGKLTLLHIQGVSARLTGQWLDDRSDFATVFVPDTKFKLQPLALEPPKPGDVIAVSGYDYAITTRPKIRHYHGMTVKAEPGEFATSDISCPVGCSGGPVVNNRSELVGIAVFSSSFQANRNFREVVLAQYPVAVFAEIVKYERKPAAIAVDDLPEFKSIVELPESVEQSNLINVLLGKVEELQNQVDSLSGNSSDIIKLQDEFKALVLVINHEKHKFESRMKVLEDRKINVIVVRNGKIVDTESYTGGEDDPIVISGVGGQDVE
jgi:hypothetical protein